MPNRSSEELKQFYESIERMTAGCRSTGCYYNGWLKSKKVGKNKYGNTNGKYGENAVIVETD